MTTSMVIHEHGNQYNVDIDFDMEPYQPAVIGGPPDSCSPEEGGEIQINDFNITSIVKEDGTKELIDIIEKKALEISLLKTYDILIDTHCFNSGLGEAEDWGVADGEF